MPKWSWMVFQENQSKPASKQCNFKLGSSTTRPKDSYRGTEPYIIIQETIMINWWQGSKYVVYHQLICCTPIKKSSSLYQQRIEWNNPWQHTTAEQGLEAEKVGYDNSIKDVRAMGRFLEVKTIYVQLDLSGCDGLYEPVFCAIVWWCFGGAE